ncbi:MAG TPA: hypothetical protein VER04_09465 [Polyangiaceae bacterium]|nr:hypothetical protein [Polyangiaceae bacterium]
MSHRTLVRALLVASLGFTSLIGCGSDEESAPSGKLGASCDPQHDPCNTGLTCAEMPDGDHRCYAETILRGLVKDASSGQPVAGAHVMALNDKGAPVTDVAKTDTQGNYELSVPTARGADGEPIDSKFTLRAAAQDYQAFPYGSRVALPIAVEGAALEDNRYVVENALTSVDLIPLPAGDRSLIEGSIVALAGHADAPIGGVLVVATGGDGAESGISDKSGAFSVFNVPAGSQELKAYGAHIQLESKSVTVTTDALTGVALHELDAATTTVSGNVQLVNAPGGSMTSVILVVEDTFDASVARGEAPSGLRAPGTGAPNVTGAFSIAGVPAGKYVVLAAYENDDLVRDPDTSISGTDFVHIEVKSGEPTLEISDGFKVTQALGTVAPGVDGPEAVSEKPDLVWADDSSEDGYALRVFDALGNEVWQQLDLPPVKGSKTVSVKYEGPLDPGMYYQFRVSSWRQPSKGERTSISTTEDLRGVFFLPTP